MGQANEPSTTAQPSEMVGKSTAQVKSPGCGVAILLIIGFTVAGLLGGILLGIAGEMPTWSHLDLGQDKAVRFLGADDPDSSIYPRRFYISMASGKVYYCLLENYDPKLGKRCFEVATEQVSEKRAECPSNPIMPPTPREVADLLCDHRDTFSNAYIAILSDGSLWEWIEYKTLGPVGVGLGAPVGLFVGFILGVFAAVLWMARRKRSGWRKIQSES